MLTPSSSLHPGKLGRLKSLGHMQSDAFSWSCILDDVRFQLEYAVRDYYFTLQWPRTVAMAAILNALDDVTGSDRLVTCRVFPPVVNEHFPSPSEVADLKAVKQRLRAVMGRDEPAEDDTVVLSDRIMTSCTY